MPDTFTTPDDLAARVTAAIRNWEQQQQQPHPTEPPPADPQPYLTWLYDETRYIDIRGIQVGSQRIHRLDIRQLYTPLTTLGQDAGPGGHRPVPLQQALARPRIVIVGDPGSGKTTFLHRIACAVCETKLGLNAEGAAEFLGPGPVPFPMLLRAGRLVPFIRDRRGKSAFPSDPDSPDWVPLCLATTAGERQWPLDAAFFRAQLRQGGLLLIDGLDEAPDRASRKDAARLVEQVGRAYPEARIAVTSRPPAYGGESVIPGFDTVFVSPLDPAAMAYFLDQFCRAIYADEVTAVQHCTALQEEIRSRPEIRRLAAVPVMLTALAVLHWNDKHLPDQRAELYDAILFWLARSHQTKPGRLPADRCLNLMKQLAWEMQTHVAGKQVDISPAAAAQVLAPHFREEPDDLAKHAAAEKFLETEGVDSGILVTRGDMLRFWHLTFQEYFVAQVLAVRSQERSERLIARRGAFQRDWRESVLLLAGLLYRQEVRQLDEFVAALLGGLGPNPGLRDRAECVGLLGSIVADLRVWDYRIGDERYRQHLQAVEAIFDAKQAAAIDFQTRLEAAEALGQAGDPRLRRDNWFRLEGGTFWMGAQKEDPGKPNYDPGAYDAENPVRSVSVSPFAIARYPVTVEEYARFLESGGYAEQSHWAAGGFGQFESPEDWGDQAPHRNRPVVGVSWYEAAAYCAWAGCRLPTEAEWEFAARRAGGRYPWGDPEPDSSRANFQLDPGHPTPVGLYPAGATPDGIQDMAGNVWEWMEDWFAAYQRSKPGPVRDPKGPATGDMRVLRGGSWNDFARNLRVSDRDWFVPINRYSLIGFRCTREGLP